MRILVVNDQPLRVVLPLKFLGSPFDEYVESFDQARSAEYAIEILKENPNAYDIIFTDYFMGKRTGADIARYVYDHKLNVPVILFPVNSYGSDFVKENLFHGYLSNDFTGNDYQEVISYASNFLVNMKKQHFEEK